MSENDKAAVVKFHEKIKAFCVKREMKCDGGEEADCPFVEFCYRAKAEIPTGEIVAAVELLSRL